MSSLLGAGSGQVDGTNGSVQQRCFPVRSQSVHIMTRITQSVSDVLAKQRLSYANSSQHIVQYCATVQGQ
jgi:hypothetical protein